MDVFDNHNYNMYKSVHNYIINKNVLLMFFPVLVAKNKVTIECLNPIILVIVTGISLPTLTKFKCAIDCFTKVSVENCEINLFLKIYLILDIIIL